MSGSNCIVLRVHELTKVFDGLAAVDHLSFTLSHGEIVGILGVNGAGKTTTLQMLLGLIRPTSGRIEVFGQEFERHRIDILHRMNFSSVGVSLPMNLRVRQNLWVFAKLYGVKDVSKRMDHLLELLEIAHLRDAVTGQLSSGELTRLNLCKALLNRPQLLLLDEPTASLDPNIADKVRKVLREMQGEQGMAILYTSHNMRDVEEVCDRVLFMHKGRLIAEGTPQHVVERFHTRSLEELFIHIARSGDVVAGGDGV